MKSGPQAGTARRWWWLVLGGAALGAAAAFIGLRATSNVHRAARIHTRGISVRTDESGVSNDHTMVPTALDSAPEAGPIHSGAVLRWAAAAGLGLVLLLAPLAVFRQASRGDAPPSIEVAVVGGSGDGPVQPPQSSPASTLSPVEIPAFTDDPLGEGPAPPGPPGEVATSDAVEIAGATTAAPALLSNTAGDPASTVSASAAPPAPGAVSPELREGSARAPVFEARFDGSQPGWPNDPLGPAIYENGGYRVTSQPGQFAAIAAPSAPVFRDVAISATFQKVGAPPGGIYGLVVRDAGPPPRDGSNQNGDFYVLGVDDGGRYGVWRREGDQWIDIVPLTPADAVRVGTQPNHLAVLARDDLMTLAVNGADVVTVLGAEPRPGTVGILVAGDANEVLVTHLEARPALPTAENAAPVPTSTGEAAAPEVEAVAPRAEAGARATRAATIGAPPGFTSAFLREAPTSRSRSLATLQNGTPVDVLPETAVADGFTWLRVRTQSGLLGWIVSTALAE